MHLNQAWLLTCLSKLDIPALSIDFPHDVHSALLDAELIVDPYWRDTETSLDWVHESEWLAENIFYLDTLTEDHYTLSFEGVDCHVKIVLNGVEIGGCQNQFMRHDFEVSKLLRLGDNVLQVLFLSNSVAAKEAHQNFPFPVPYQEHNCRIPHYNFLRKTQCHAGWDWNIALSPLGIYGDVTLRVNRQIRLNDVRIKQLHDLNAKTVNLHVSLFYTAWAVCQDTAELNIDGQTISCAIEAYPGEHEIQLEINVENPKLWWPAGEGEQTLYALNLRLGDERRELSIGFKQVELLTDKEHNGARFALRINGREIFMRGANWIPADALPARITAETVGDLLQSARDANMNMLRVWGGGQYEPDYFYQRCSELGLLVWQDFMFSCNLYPAADKHWLQQVRLEAKMQVRRLSKHACLALWCGDNELVGALGWFEESQKDRDRYLAMYDRLNHTLELVLDEEALDVPFWPSSPSIGRLNFGDGWHDDSSGDMHFWDVWHEAKDFEHYRTVQPRFCSEFGFQSFPSSRVLQSVTEPHDRNVSSAVMEVHQRNVGGNGRIVETLARYFRFPAQFEHMLYLSQVAQGLAMQTAIEFWRSCKPRCMGTLYWQLNDTWPVASWASLEYGGGWKLTHYLARRFYDPVLVTAQPEPEGSGIVLWAICDLPAAVLLEVELFKVSIGGNVEAISSQQVQCGTVAAQEFARLPSTVLGGDEFLFFSWRDSAGEHVGESHYLPKRPKDYNFELANISVETHVNVQQQTVITLSTDKPALYVTYDHGSDAVYSDNCFTLLPSRKKQLTVVRERSSLSTRHPKSRFLPQAAHVWSLCGQTTR